MSATDVSSDADQLVRRAHEASYRFPPGFNGFRADVLFMGDGVDGRGEVTFRPDKRPELQIDLPEEEERWLAHELGSVAGHRFHRPYEKGDGRSSKRLPGGPDGALGRLVEIEDAMGSSYRIGNGLINEISRTHGGSRFTIVIQERGDAPDGRVVSSSFTVCHWDAETTRLVRADIYSDAYVKHEGILLPASRRVATATDAGITARQLELEGHELLAEAAS